MGLCLLSPLLSAKDVSETMNQEKKKEEKEERGHSERKGRDKTNK